MNKQHFIEDQNGTSDINQPTSTKSNKSKTKKNALNTKSTQRQTHLIFLLYIYPLYAPVSTMIS